MAFYSIDVAKGDTIPVKSIQRLSKEQYDRIMSPENRDLMVSLGGFDSDFDFWTEFKSPSGNMSIIIIDEDNFIHLPKYIRDQVTLHMRG